ncbi:MAG TPA: pyrimidine 5'-nucleotidase [Anaerolineaceae bacterium]
MRYSTLLIDLDDTLYPASCGLWAAIRNRIDLYLVNKFGFSYAEAGVLRTNLFLQYGTTLRGLQALHHVDEEEFLAFVHNVPLKTYIQADPSLRQALLSYPQRKVIFTNADSAHARRVLNVCGLDGLFDKIIDIHTFEPFCKPMPEAFRIAIELLGEEAQRCVLVDDALPNLLTANTLGMHTIWISGSPAPSPINAAIPALSDLPQVLSLKM